MPRKRELARRAEKVAAIVGALPAPDRARLLHLAGYDEHRLVRLLQTTLKLLEDKLDAHVVQRLVVGVGRGINEVREYHDRDHSVELRAADMLMQFLGVYPGRNTGGSGGGGDTHIHLTLQSMDDRPKVEVIDVTPNPA